MSDELKRYELTDEAYREYDLPGRAMPYRIEGPIALFFKPGATTHRVLDELGLVHCVPAPGVVPGVVLRWRPKNALNPVQF